MVDCRLNLMVIGDSSKILSMPTKQRFVRRMPDAYIKNVEKLTREDCREMMTFDTNTNGIASVDGM
jgi:hypothetical protein